MNIPQAFALAQQHHQAGRLKDAEALYRQILAVQPRHAGALHFLGVMAYQLGQHETAIERIRQSLSLDPNNFAAHSNLGEAYRKAGRTEDAIASFRRALELKPDHPEAHNNLGIAFKEKGELDEALACYRRSLELRPENPEAHNNLGSVLAEQGQFDGAIAAFRRALELRPDYGQALSNLGAVLARQGELDEALATFRQALALTPADVDALVRFSNLLRERGRLDEALSVGRRALKLQPGHAEAHLAQGNALRDLGQMNEAEATFRQALELWPDNPAIYNNLGIALASQGRFDDAVTALRRAAQLQPADPYILNNLGTVLKDQGRWDAAIPEYRRALEVSPDCQIAHSNLIYLLHFHPGYDARMIAEENERWSRQFADPLKSSIMPHTNERNPERRLRIGYVSPDFRLQAESFFVVPLLEAHDHRQFEIHCYASVARPDQTTERLRRCADVWHDVQGLSDHHLAERIRGDGIDLLVDLTMHMADNRLAVFARKPAPVQVAWLAYPGSTGLKTIDYLLTDRYLAPLENERPFYTEEPVTLPDCWVTYHPLTNGPSVNALAAATAPGITFGSLNNFCKMNDETLQRFANVLRAVEGSRLMLLASAGSGRQRLLDQFASHGVSPARIEFIAATLRDDYFKLYHRIDIGLDPLPYNGITTTCDALWMGVPVVSLVGKTAAGRAGLGILSTLGLPELATKSPEEFVEVAKRLADDRPGLVRLRETLRPRMEASPLMDAPRFARNVEAAYRTMWERWCAQQRSSLP